MVQVIVQYYRHIHTKGCIVFYSNKDTPFIAVLVRTVNHSRLPVNECNNDVLDIDILMKLSTGTQERVQGLEVKLIWEHLFKQDIIIS